MATRDYYKELGVSKDATLSEIKKAYRELARKYHPDKNPGDSEAATRRFQEVKKAYEVLSSEKDRKLYDRVGHAAFEQAGAASGGPDFSSMGDVFSDLGGIFGDFFGGGKQSTTRPQRGADLRYNLSLDLEEAVFGCTTSIRIPRLGRCLSCEGTGARKGTSPMICRNCEGTGQVYLQHGLFNIQQTCADCQGLGQVIASPCSECRGQGQVRETRTLSIKIPPGIDEGDRIRLAGEGEAGSRGGPSGDLYVQIQLRSHSLFKRKGRDLFCEVPVSYATAVLGGDIEVPTLEGVTRVHVPASTPGGKVFRLRGKGISGGRTTASGDLFCTLVIETTVNLDSKQKSLLRSFEDSLKAADKHYPRIQQWLSAMRRFFMKKTGGLS